MSISRRAGEKRLASRRSAKWSTYYTHLETSALKSLIVRHYTYIMISRALAYVNMHTYIHARVLNGAISSRS